MIAHGDRARNQLQGSCSCISRRLSLKYWFRELHGPYAFWVELDQHFVDIFLLEGAKHGPLFGNTVFRFQTT